MVIVLLAVEKVVVAIVCISHMTTPCVAPGDRLTGKKLTPFYHDDPKEGLARGK